MHRSGREAMAAEVRDNAGLLAETVVEAMRAAHPEMFSRYGAAGRRRCLEDTQFHLEHLAAALDVDDPGEFLASRAFFVNLVAESATRCTTNVVADRKALPIRS